MSVRGRQGCDADRIEAAAEEDAGLAGSNASVDRCLQQVVEALELVGADPSHRLARWRRVPVAKQPPNSALRGEGVARRHTPDGFEEGLLGPEPPMAQVVDQHRQIHGVRYIKPR